jgi:hypothetical protein
MRAVKRSDVTLGPDVLARAEAELAAYKLKPDDFDFKAYKSDEIKQALDALFHGKCAYCETFYSASAPVDVEHYRPKGAVAEDPKHSGYWWLAMRWENLLPSCIDCNRKRKQKVVATATTLEELWRFGKEIRNLQGTQSGKKDSFPIAAAGVRLVNEEVDFGRERALLVNPCEDAPEQFMSFAVDGHGVPAVVHALDGDQTDSRGNASIQVYGLNRLGLVQDRTRVLRQLEFLADMVLEVTEIADKVDALPASRKAGIEQVPSRLRILRERLLNEMAEMTSARAPYSAMAREWLASFQAKLLL